MIHLPGSAPSKRYGWLAHLRSCMTTFSSLILLAFPAPFTISISFIRIFVYLLSKKKRKQKKDTNTLNHATSVAHVPIVLPFSLQFRESYVDLHFFLWRQLLLHVRLEPSEEKRSKYTVEPVYQLGVL